MPIITLLTDFGAKDPYVGVMKGVVLGICPECQLVDLTHQVDPQNVAGGALQLERAAPHFPLGTIHLAVVDPGVGSARKAVAVATDRAFFVGPDNGLLTRALRDQTILAAVELPLPEGASHTFHGRDLFAPAAACLAAGSALGSLGKALTTPLVELPGHDGHVSIAWVDHFGNMLTNFHRSMGQRPVAAIFRGRTFPLRDTYASVGAGEGLALFGSDGYLELACNGGNAAARFRGAAGDPVELHF